jgi:uncharacterized membrane protein
MISPSAAVCPNCGHDHAKDRKTKSDNTQTFLILGLMAVFLLLWKLDWLDDIFNFFLDLFKKN